MLVLQTIKGPDGIKGSFQDEQHLCHLFQNWSFLTRIFSEEQGFLPMLQSLRGGSVHRRLMDQIQESGNAHEISKFTMSLSVGLDWWFGRSIITLYF